MTEAERKAAGDAAADLFANSALRSFARDMAKGHRYALDVIRQAPVIVLAANGGRTSGCAWKASENAAAQLAWALEHRPKLHAVMGLFGCPSPLRRISGKAISPKDWDALRFLGGLPAQRVAPAIPETARAQKAWLNTIGFWSARLEQRSRNRFPDLRYLGMEWAMDALRDVPKREERTAGDLADFYAVAVGAIAQPGVFGDRPVFDPGWSYEQARRAQERWHVALSKIRVDAATFEAAGFANGAAVPYHPFPDEPVTIEGLEFVPVRTCEGVFEEGARMHHCAASYAPDVSSGNMRLFSIREQGRRVATVCYLRRGAHGLAYELAQVAGICNTDPKGAWVKASKLLFADAMRKLTPEPPAKTGPRTLRDAFPNVGGQFSDDAAAG